MKKFLLSLAACLGLGFSAAADTVTFDFTSNDYGLPNNSNTYVTNPTTLTQDGVELTLNGANGWRMWTDGLRCYPSANPTFTVSCPGGVITEVSWDAAPTFALQGTTQNITSWTGSQESVTFVRTGTGNTAVKSITITYSTDGTGGGGTTEPEQPSEPGEDTNGAFTFNFTSNDYGLPNNSSTYVTNPTTLTQEGIELTLTGANGWRMWTDGLRSYPSANPTFTVSCPGGIVTEVSWDAASTFALEGTTQNITSWTGSQESVTFVRTGSGNTAIKSITIKYTISSGGETPSTPEAYEAPFANKTFDLKVGETLNIDRGNKYPTKMIMAESGVNNILDIDDEAFTITAKATGTTEVEVIWDSDDNFTDGYTSFTVNVTEVSQPGEDTNGAFTFDFTSNDYGLPNNSSTYVTNPTTLTQEGIELTLTGANGWRMWTDGLRSYPSANPTFTVSCPGGVVTEVSWDAASSFALEGTTQNITSWTGSQESVTFTRTGTGNTAVKTITIKYTVSGGSDTPSIPEAYEAPFANQTYNMTVGETLNIERGSKYPAEMIMVAQTEGVVDINEDNFTITASEVGSTIINVVWDADDNFTEGEAAFTVNVTEAPQPGVTANVTFDAAAQGYANAEDVTDYEADGIKFVFDKGSNSNAPKYYTSGTALRCYGGNTITISAPEGSNIVNVTYTFGTGDGTNAITSDVPTWTSPTWTGSSNTVVFTIGGTSGNRRIQKIEVTYEGGEAPAVLSPVISCEDNKVTITCETEGADIYYTVNGDEPSNESKLYSVPFSITENTTVKAIAYKDGEKSSVTTYEAKYIGSYPGFAELVAAGTGAEGTIEGPITAVYQNGQYLYVVDSKDYPMLVYGNVNQTVVNGNAFESVSGKYSPYNGLPELTNPTLGTLTSGNAVEPTVITLSEMTADLVNTYVTINDVTLSEDLKISDSTDEGVLYKRFSDVTIPTDYSSHYNVTGFVSIFNETVQLYPTEFEAITVENQVETPYFTPAAGAVAIGSMIAIECTTEDAVIYYTIDGTEPTTESNPYSEPFEINEAMTVKAIATKEGMINSSIAVAEYTVYDPNAKEGNFDFEDPTNLNPAIEPSTVVSTGIDIDGKTFTSNAVSLEIGESEAANKPRIWTTTSYATEMRVYKGDSFTVIVDNDVYHITSIDFSKASGNFDMEPSSGSLKISGNSATWTPTATEGVSLLSDENISSVTFNITDKTYIRTITVHYAEGSGITTGVDEIAVDDADAVYFNLQGVQVKNPAHGIYIKVVGNKATKVVL